ncbi:ASTRA complex subunit [Lambiella insularis]|nr:ASTRA complex subunit [Lambiella insularis]
MPTEALPPPQPVYVLRGHTSQIHALCFAHSNSRLFTGDADGWVVCWSLAYKRPTVVWKAHESPILGLAVWGADRLITHGRDSRIVVWKLGLAEEAALDKTLPVEDAVIERKKPEVLHSLTVNTLNFCAFAWCWDQSGPLPGTNVEPLNNRSSTPAPILIAVPNSLNSDAIDIFHLPSERRTSTIPASKALKTGPAPPPLYPNAQDTNPPPPGMVMALSLSLSPHPPTLRLLAGYESGHTLAFAQPSPTAPWQILYAAQPHSQPSNSPSLPTSVPILTAAVLSLAPSPSAAFYLTTSADALVAKHPLLSAATAVDPDRPPLKTVNTKHAGQQGVCVRSDGRIYATAGWDARVRVYSAKTMRELAVLRWHKEGCYAVAFADVGGPGMAVSGGQEAQSEIGSENALARVAADGQLAAAMTPATASVAPSTVAQQRDRKAQTTHWLAAGSKDGKVSLWDIF